jgi:hypothetical protein
MEDTLSEHLDFLVARGGEDEATVLAQALRKGIDALYEEVLVEEFLLGRVARETVLRALGPDRLDEIEYQRDVLQREVRWGLKIVYFDPEIHRALRLKAAATERSVSDLVNEAVGQALGEDADDLEIFGAV